MPERGVVQSSGAPFGWRGWLLVGAVLLVAVPLAAQEEPGAGPTLSPGQQEAAESGRPGVIRLPRGDETEEGTGEEAEGEAPDEGLPPEVGPDEEPLTPGEEGQPGAPGAPGEGEGEDTRPPIIRPQRLVGNPEEELPRHFEDEFNPFEPPPGVRVNVDFVDADLTDLVMWFSALTGQNFIIAENVQAGKRITIIGPTPVTIQEAYRAFMAALHMNGLTVVPYGTYLRIVPEEGIAQQALPFSDVGQAAGDDRMVTQIIPIDHIDASSITDLLESMKTANGIIQVYAPTNTLIITETGTNLRRMLELIDQIDTPGGDTRYVYQVRYANAEELRDVLLEIFGQPDEQQQAPPERRRRRRNQDEEQPAETAATTETTEVHVSQIVADARTNQLIIVASPRSYEAIAEMAEALDVPIAGEGQIHVLFLENANATDLASTLQGLTQSVAEARGEEAGAQRRRLGEEDTQTGDEQPAGPEGAITATFTGDVSITADEPTNSLVVVASLRDFLNLQRVVGELDRRREQVYVEAVIMEVTVTNDGSFGIALNAGALPSIGGDDVPVFGASSLGGLSSVVLDPTALQGLAVGLRGPEVPGTEGLLAPGIGLPSFGAILQALQTDTNVNVLSTPHILTTDNEEAEIIVGENIPFITGGSGGGGLSSLLSQAGNLGGDVTSQLGNLNLGSLGVPSFNVQRESVSLTLRIRPQINESNFVRLEIEEQVENVISVDQLRGPTTSNREARTVVVVQDQQTVVIGGLIQDDVTDTIDKVPFFGDIPIIGYLFRHTTTRAVKRNLLLLLTPYIIRDPSDFHAIFRRKMEERQEFLEFFGREHLDYVAGVDYSRKNGPLESIFETLRSAQQNEEDRRRAQGLHDGPQLLPQLESSPIGGDDGGGTETGGGE